jgi:hypothetical protein
MLFNAPRITAFFAPKGETDGKKAGFSMTKSDILIVLTFCYFPHIILFTISYSLSALTCGNLNSPVHETDIDFFGCLKGVHLTTSVFSSDCRRFPSWVGTKQSGVHPDWIASPCGFAMTRR